MARFRWLGEIERPYVVSYGPTIAIKLHKKDGTKQVIEAADPEVGFVVGEDLGTDITDPRALRHCRADPRFEEIV